MAGRVVCECSCGELAHFNNLVEVKIEQATDETLRSTNVVRRFFVRRECADAFRDELAAMALLQMLVRQAVTDPWWRRMLRARKVAQLQHIIYERTRGLDYASRKAKQSALLFAAPKWMQGFLSRMLLAREKRATRNSANRAAAASEGNFRDAESTAAAVSS